MTETEGMSTRRAPRTADACGHGNVVRCGRTNPACSRPRSCRWCGARQQAGPRLADNQLAGLRRDAARVSSPFADPAQLTRVRKFVAGRSKWAERWPATTPARTTTSSTSPGSGRIIAQTPLHAGRRPAPALRPSPRPDCPRAHLRGGCAPPTGSPVSSPLHPAAPRGRVMSRPRLARSAGSTGLSPRRLATPGGSAEQVGDHTLQTVHWHTFPDSAVNPLMRDSRGT